MPLPKNSANIIKIEIPTPITIPVKGWEIGQSLPSLAQLEIKINRKEVKINSVNKVELILIDFSILAKAGPAGKTNRPFFNKYFSMFVKRILLNFIFLKIILLTINNLNITSAKIL